MSTAPRPGVTLWLRRTHRWFGLWGATFGLLVGFSGIWLNHRAVLKLPFAQEMQNSQIALPDPTPADPEATVAWLRGALRLDAPTSVRVEKARPLPWAERGTRTPSVASAASTASAASAALPASASPPAATASAGAAAPRLMQPERWLFSFGGPHSTIQAELWVGNHSVSLRRVDNGVIGTLTNLHKGIGMPVAWILLVDTLAGSLVFLSISGVLLWWQTRRRHRLEGLVFAISALLIIGLAISRL